jgi:hypothetical protein
MASMKRWLSGIVVLLVAGLPPAVRAETSASPLADDPTLIALAVALSCADAPEAIEAAPQGPGGPAAGGPEIELVATVRAKTLKFDEVPKVDVVFRGTSKRRTVWKTERVNLPVHPQPGVVYRDVQVRLTISSDLDELTAMLRDAKRASRGIRIEDPAAPVAPAAAKVADPPRPAHPAAPAPAPAPVAAKPGAAAPAPKPLAASAAPPASPAPAAAAAAKPVPSPGTTPAPAATAAPASPAPAPAVNQVPAPAPAATPATSAPAAPPEARPAAVAPVPASAAAAPKPTVPAAAAAPPASAASAAR